MDNNGYTTIEINGHKVGLKFNVYAVEEFGLTKPATGALKNFTAVVWAGLCGNAYVKKMEPELTWEELCDWVGDLLASENPADEINRICEVFNNARDVQASMKRVQSNGSVEDEDAKKKIVEALT